ncbi:MAG: hypothetical protein SGPRY_010285, partial [Prymnesium sp.]
MVRLSRLPRLPRLASSFALCFELREGMLLLSAGLLFSALFWSASIVLRSSWDAWVGSKLEWATIGMLLMNAGVGVTSVRTDGEAWAALHVLTFGTLFVLLCSDFALAHHLQCLSSSHSSRSTL